jgi:hypothetical protein
MLSDAERNVLNSALEKYRPGQSEPILVGGENLLKPALQLTKALRTAKQNPGKYRSLEAQVANAFRSTGAVTFAVTQVGEVNGLEALQTSHFDRGRRFLFTMRAFAMSNAAAATSGGGSDRRQAAPRFLGFFCARLSCRAATMSITLLRAGFGGGAWRFWPLALSSISFFTSSL